MNDDVLIVRQNEHQSFRLSVRDIPRYIIFKAENILQTFFPCFLIKQTIIDQKSFIVGGKQHKKWIWGITLAEVVMKRVFERIEVHLFEKNHRRTQLNLLSMWKNNDTNLIYVINSSNVLNESLTILNVNCSNCQLSKPRFMPRKNIIKH